MAWGHAGQEAYGGARSAEAMRDAVAEALGAGAAEADNMDVGAVAAQDTSGTASRMADEGLISQGTVNEGMYPGHTEAAAAVGASGINAFGQKHKDFIANNKAQMIAMGIQPSHRAGGKLTGRYSSNDWKAFQRALAGGTMATEEFDDESITMEDSVARDVAQQGHPDWGMSGVAPNQGPYTAAITEEQAMGMPAPLGPSASPYVDDFSAYGQQVQPGVTSQVDMGTGYAPAPMTGPEQFTNFTAATTPMSGVQPQGSQYDAMSQLGAMGHQFAPGNPQGYMPNYTTQQSVEDQLSGGGAAAVDSFTNMPVAASADPTNNPFQEPMYNADSYPGGSYIGYQPGVGNVDYLAGQMTTPQQGRPTPSDYEQASLWRSGSFPVYGAQASGDSYNRMGGSLSSAPPGGQRTSGGDPVNYESIVGIPRMYNVEGTESGNIGPYGSYGEMDEGTLDPNAGLIVRGTQGQGGVSMDATYPAAMQTIMDQAMPIADGTDAPELIKNSITAGGTNEQRMEDLINAGLPKVTIDRLMPEAVAMVHFALTQFLNDNPDKKVKSFTELAPYLKKFQMQSGMANSSAAQSLSI